MYDIIYVTLKRLENLAKENVLRVTLNYELLRSATSSCVAAYELWALREMCSYGILCDFVKLEVFLKDFILIVLQICLTSCNLI